MCGGSDPRLVLKYAYRLRIGKISTVSRGVSELRIEVRFNTRVSAYGVSASLSQ